MNTNSKVYNNLYEDLVENISELKEGIDTEEFLNRLPENKRQQMIDYLKDYYERSEISFAVTNIDNQNKYKAHLPARLMFNYEPNINEAAHWVNTHTTTQERYDMCKYYADIFVTANKMRSSNSKMKTVPEVKDIANQLNIALTRKDIQMIEYKQENPELKWYQVLWKKIKLFFGVYDR